MRHDLQMAMTNEPSETSITLGPRRWVRFTIRGILVMTALLAVFLGYRANIARREQAAIELVRVHGCSPRYRHDIFGNLPSFAPGFVREAIGVEYFGSVVRLNFLDGYPKQDEAFSMFDRLPNVTVMNTDGALITDEGIAPIRHLARLTCLRLNNAKNISDDGLQYLGKLLELDLLDLSGTSITDQGLAELRHLKRLEILGLDHTAVTDRGIMELRHMKSLRLLKLQGTSVTANGIKMLKSELPDCQLTYD